MKAVCELTPDEYLALHKKCHNLSLAVSGAPRSDFINYTKKHTYAKYSYTGSYTDKLVAALGRHPDEEEIIMLVDNGYSHFGAACSLDTNTKTFSGYVRID